MNDKGDPRVLITLYVVGAMIVLMCLAYHILREVAIWRFLTK